jgi:hypothetical protein
MNDTYSSSPLEQTILRAIRGLEGSADLDSISAKVNKSFPEDIPSRRIGQILRRLEARHYISHSFVESPQTADRDTPRTLYRIETFGERALKVPPVLDMAGSVAAMKRNVFIVFVLFLIQNINSWTVKNAFVGRYIPFIVLGVAVETILSALRVRRMVYRGE